MVNLKRIDSTSSWEAPGAPNLIGAFSLRWKGKIAAYMNMDNTTSFLSSLLFTIP